MRLRALKDNDRRCAAATESLRPMQSHLTNSCMQRVTFRGSE